MTAAGLSGEGSGDPGAAAAPSGAASIGAVLDSLRPEFPEITISKIRFLESEGLISPARTPAGYRQFAPADVRRLRFVLSAQRDHYLPLKVIRTRLDEFDRDPTPDGPVLASATSATPATPAVPGTPAPAATPPPDRPRPTAVPAHAASPAGAGPAGPVAAPRPSAGSARGVLVDPGPAAGTEPVGRDALLAEDGVDDALIDGLEQHGVLHRDDAGTYEPDAVAVARTAAALAGLGVEPRLLRGLRAGAEREAGLLAQLLIPVARHRGPDAGRRAEELGHELAALSGHLHALLVGAGLRRTLRR